MYEVFYVSEICLLDVINIFDCIYFLDKLLIWWNYIMIVFMKWIGRNIYFFGFEEDYFVGFI